MRYWLFVNDDRVAEWPSLESCQAQARSYDRADLKWERAEYGPQGNAPHWYATGRRHSPLSDPNYYTIVEVNPW